MADQQEKIIYRQNIDRWSDIIQKEYKILQQYNSFCFYSKLLPYILLDKPCIKNARCVYNKNNVKR